ncbi:MAG: leucyl aminopeptidase family protein, partial [Beijerinckiaceae bacterium]
GPFAGAITAALFLKKFAGQAKTWAHFDIYAWNQFAKPGRPEGAEAQTLRLLYRYLEGRFA